ncbi:hypothetical protein MGN01_19370 [Methylobacterium gnaphalii]|uniref:Uncharacterized protein n=1 Tax=Methylobacterium gnaphalii TaxID=1010610 RepID=A0A512JJN7_9HYPH|nr:hypothetical protein MGN01_19370 [Methylobacterium gnaphalii]GLS48362.1 hypothetical protein GCM10007885_12060 [Methylobacterium gnaphalii]
MAVMVIPREIERGEDAGERARIAGDAVGQDGAIEPGKAPWIAVGAEHEPGAALRLQALDDAVEQGPAVEAQQCLVPAAHAAGEAAGQDKPEGRRRHGTGRYSMTMRGAARLAGEPLRFIQSVCAISR